MKGTPLKNVLAYDRPLVCIVRFSDEYGSVNGIPREAPHVFYQVIADPAKVSKSGRFIEFGQAGEQIAGWKPLDAIEVHEILGEAVGKGEMRAFEAPDNVTELAA